METELCIQLQKQKKGTNLENMISGQRMMLPYKRMGYYIIIKYTI